jgi:hypothetical protein
MATPASEASMEWREAQMLRLVEGIRFNPERLAAYVADNSDGTGFLDFMIERLGGRSQ